PGVGVGAGVRMISERDQAEVATHARLVPQRLLPSEVAVVGGLVLGDRVRIGFFVKDRVVPTVVVADPEEEPVVVHAQARVVPGSQTSAARVTVPDVAAP